MSNGLCRPSQAKGPSQKFWFVPHVSPVYTWLKLTSSCFISIPYRPDTVVKKSKFPPRNRQNIFSYRCGTIFVYYCIMVIVLHYLFKLEVDVSRSSVSIWVLPIQPLISKVATLWERSLTWTQKSFRFLSFMGNTGPVSGQKLTFLTTVYRFLWTHSLLRYVLNFWDSPPEESFNERHFQPLFCAVW